MSIDMYIGSVLGITQHAPRHFGFENTISWFSDATIMRQRNAYISATVQTRIWWTNVSLHCSRDKRCPSIIDESFFLNVKNLCEIVESDFENFDICHSSQTLWNNVDISKTIAAGKKLGTARLFDYFHTPHVFGQLNIINIQISFAVSDCVSY